MPHAQQCFNRGGRQATPGIRISRAVIGHQRPRVRITLGPDVLGYMDPSSGKRLRVEFLIEEGRLRLGTTADAVCPRLEVRHRSATAEFIPAVVGLPSDPHPATLCAYEVHPGGILVDLPEWFFRPGAQRTRPCMTCKRGFLSDGAHHRMCETCRPGAGLTRQFEQASI